MSKSSSDDDRLGATEARMRRALGLGGQPSLAPGNAPPTPVAAGTHRPAHRFIRDGELPVTVLHRDQDDGATLNKLEAARQALREQVAAREHAEQLLQEAQVTIRDLQTKLAHERLASDEAVRRVEGEVQTMRQALQTIENEVATQRVALVRAERDRDQAIAGRQKALERSREEAKQVNTVSRATRLGRRAMTTGVTGGPAASDALAKESDKARGTIAPKTLPATDANA
jgi:hypothetical protein